MKAVRFWGTRGSLPVALTARGVRDKLLAACAARAAGRSPATPDLESHPSTAWRSPVVGTYGGHTSCVQLETGGPDYVLCDLGSGAAAVRPGGVARHGAPDAPQTFHVFMSHLHWDHIMGLPFFVPAYIPGNRVAIYGSHDELEAALRRQQDNAVVSGRLLDLRRDARVRPPRARPRARDRGRARSRSMLQRHARRLLRLPLRGAAARSSCTPPTPSTRLRPGREPSAS